MNGVEQVVSLMDYDELGDYASDADPLDCVRLAEVRLLAMRIVRSLEDPFRTIIVMNVMNGDDIASVASILGVTRHEFYILKQSAIRRAINAFVRLSSDFTPSMPGNRRPDQSDAFRRWLWAWHLNQ
jgi:hypothetical protein